MSTESQQTISDEQNKKKFRENIAAYVYVKEYIEEHPSFDGSGSKWENKGYTVFNMTDYTVDEVVISYKERDYDLGKYVDIYKTYTFIPAHSHGKEYFHTYNPIKIISIKCRTLGLN